MLRLASPMQSWGTDSKLEVRRTDRYPSKSGLTGLLAAALGIARTGDLTKLNGLRIGVRVERPGEIICDYQTAQGAKSQDRYTTYRYYLSDAVFLAGIESDDEPFLQELETALLHPTFPLYLGRRSCPITLPLVKGIRNTDLLSALKDEPPLFGENTNDLTYIYYETSLDDEEGMAVRDLAVTFNPRHRRYGYRKVREQILKHESPMETDHDPTVGLQEME